MTRGPLKPAQVTAAMGLDLSANIQGPRFSMIAEFLIDPGIDGFLNQGLAATTTEFTTEKGNSLSTEGTVCVLR